MCDCRSLNTCNVTVAPDGQWRIALSSRLASALLWRQQMFLARGAARLLMLPSWMTSICLAGRAVSLSYPRADGDDRVAVPSASTRRQLRGSRLRASKYWVVREVLQISLRWVGKRRTNVLRIFPNATSCLRRATDKPNRLPRPLQKRIRPLADELWPNLGDALPTLGRNSLSWRSVRNTKRERHSDVVKPSLFSANCDNVGALGSAETRKFRRTRRLQERTVHSPRRCGPFGSTAFQRSSITARCAGGFPRVRLHP